jgi:hypothetical protein
MKNQQSFFTRYRSSLIVISICSLLIVLQVAIIGARAFASVNTNMIFINLRSGIFGINYDPMVQHIYMWFDKHNARYDEDWEIRQIAPGLYQMRSKAWKEFFWQVDTVKKAAWKISNGSFGSSGGSAKRLEETSVLVFNQKDPGRIPPFGLRFTNAQLTYNRISREVTVTAEGAVVSSSDDWITAPVDNNTLHIRNSRPNTFIDGRNTFLKIDTNQARAYRIMDGNFGAAGGRELLLSEEVSELKGEVVPGTDGIEEDLGMKWDKPSSLPSPWADSEKARYRALLKQGTIYDVLVVPFQVQGYAIDRPGRSLMTRYLIDRIERTTGSRVPSHALVSKALGESMRTYSDSVINSLANDLNVKVLIKGYVGHHHDEKMKVTLLVQVRDQARGFKPSSKTVRIERKEVAFSDAHLPSEAFSGLLDGLMNDLPLRQIKKAQTRIFKKEKKIAVPDTLQVITSRPPASAVLSAYYLQFLGMLYPQENEAREYLFERSLVALQEVSPDSPDYPLLKARAYFYLYRRPAAVAALPSPATPEEKAMLAVLSGDLPMLKKAVEAIKEPLPKLIAQIELNDLLWLYDTYSAKKTGETVAKAFPGWEMLIQRRLKTSDVWTVQSNVHIKKALDDLLPIPDFTVDSIARARIARGDSLYDNPELDFSVYNHCSRLLTDQASTFLTNDSASPVQRDILDLMAAIGESNLMKMADLRIKVQALYEEGLTLLDRYELVYRGHPYFSYLRSLALYNLARAKQSLAADNLTKTAGDLAYQACWLAQGQNTISFAECSNHVLYDADYPRRFFWSPSADSARDRLLRENTSSSFQSVKLSTQKLYTLQNLEQSLRYTHAIFWYLETYYEKLRELKLLQTADDLLKKNSNRFDGNVMKTTFFAKQNEKDGNVQAAQKLYEEVVDSGHTAWGPYLNLGRLYMQQGDFKKASATFNKYPLFLAAPEEIRSDDAVNTVALSQQAFAAGKLLWWVGAIKESMPFFKRSADYQTGSGAGMRSVTLLALNDRNYELALQSSLEAAKRYNMPSDYAEYIRLLHVMGYRAEAWAVTSTLSKKNIDDSSWWPVILGHQMEGKREKEQLEWFEHNYKESTSLYKKQQYVFLSHALDRMPQKNVSDLVELMGRSADTEGKSSKEKTFLAWFADGYYQLRMKNFQGAYQVFQDRVARNVDLYVKSSGHILTYVVWSSIKNGRTSETDSYLQSYLDYYGRDFDYYLMKAFLCAGRKKHAEAMNHLKSAQYVLPDKLEDRAMYPLYQLLESCEWLYEESGYEGYRALALTWAKLYQQIQPTIAWTYSIEAEYTTAKEERLRALAITLYLDSQSDRIANIPDQEKKSAKEWLKDNNPFVKPYRSVRSKDI